MHSVAWREPWGCTSVKDAFRPEDLKLPEDPAVASMDALRSSCIVLLGSWFLMRELELATLLTMTSK